MMARDLVDIMGGGKGRAPHRLAGDDECETVKLCDLTLIFHYDTTAAVRSLTLGIQLHRAEHVRQAVFKQIVTQVAERTGCLAVFGKI
jgi:hypothetical protein